MLLIQKLNGNSNQIKFKTSIKKCNWIYCTGIWTEKSPTNKTLDFASCYADAYRRGISWFFTVHSILKYLDRNTPLKKKFDSNGFKYKTVEIKPKVCTLTFYIT